MKRLTSACALLILAACSDSTGPHPARSPAAEITFSNVIQDAQQRGIDLTLVVRVRNPSRAIIGVPSCGYWLERETESGWRTVWSPVCVGLPVLRVVQPGGEQSFEYRIIADGIGSSPLDWAWPLEGEYRLGLRIHVPDAGVTTELHATPTITIGGIAQASVSSYRLDLPPQRSPQPATRAAPRSGRAARAGPIRRSG